MKIGFFMQNIKRGGLDTFVVQLLRNWSAPDELILFCNASHPGLNYIIKSLPSTVQVKAYTLPTIHDIFTSAKTKSEHVMHIYGKLFIFFGFFIQVILLIPEYLRTNIDRLMIINGGYPGGDACLASAVAWSITKKNKVWLNIHSLSSPLSPSFLFGLRERIIDKFVANSVKGIISVSKACQNSISNRTSFSCINKQYIYNGLDPVIPLYTHSLRKELLLEENVYLILMLATYDPSKGHEFIFNVMEMVVKEIPTAHLLVCGDCSDEEYILVEKIRIKTNIISNIHLQKHRTDTDNLFAQIDLLVAPSQAYESFGYMAVEAMSCSIPVVVTDVGGLPEVVEDGVCGFVVDHYDEDEFARRIIMLLKDNDLRKSMGDQGRRRYETCFTAQKMVSQYETLVRGYSSTDNLGASRD